MAEWGFYGRSQEISEIEKILQSGRWFFCAISGRRRIGKTTLIRQALLSRPNTRVVYVQVPDSDERGVVQAFQDALEGAGVQDSTAQRYRTFPDMARAIGSLCASGIIVVIDEFQYFHRKTLVSFTSFLQAEVDTLRNTKIGGLFVLGSIHTEMMAVLEDQASPLFNRVTHRIEVKHWDFETLFEMFGAHDILDPYQRLFLWSLFEGVPKFYRDCFEHGVLKPQRDYRCQTLQRLFFEGSSPLKEEATTWFLRELRGRYDSVLKVLAIKGPCSYGDLIAEYARAGSTDGRQLSAYLKTLSDRFQMVEKLQPIFAGDRSRKARYVITDNFLQAWLRAIERNVQASRIQPLDKTLMRADIALRSHEGYAFEKMIRLLTEECSRKNVGDFELSEFVRGYWNKADGSDIELDLLAFNEEQRKLRIGSCKRSEDAHDSRSSQKFETHIGRFLRTKEGRRFSGWKVEKAVFSPEFRRNRRQELSRKGFVCRDLKDYCSFLTA